MSSSKSYAHRSPVDWRTLGLIAVAIIALFVLPFVLLGDVDYAGRLLVALAAIGGILIVCGLPAALAAAIAGGMRWSWVRQTNRMRGVTVVDFVPPRGYSMAELSGLYAGRVAPAGALAQVVNLVIGGRATLSEGEGGQYVLSVTPAEELDAADRAVLNATDDGHAIVDDAFLGRVSSQLESVVRQSFLRRRLVRSQGWVAGLFGALFLLTSFVAVGLVWWVNSLLSEQPTIGRIHNFGSFMTEFWAVWPGMTIFLAIPYFLSIRYLAYPAFASASGITGGRLPVFAQEWQNLNGYRMFVEQTEMPQLRFELSRPDGEPRMEYLPMAIALRLKVDEQAGLRQIARHGAGRAVPASESQPES